MLNLLGQLFMGGMGSLGQGSKIPRDLTGEAELERCPPIKRWSISTSQGDPTGKGVSQAKGDRFGNNRKVTSFTQLTIGCAHSPETEGVPQILVPAVGSGKRWERNTGSSAVVGLYN